MPKNPAWAFADQLVDTVKSPRLGNGLDTDAEIGPMIGARYRKKTIAYIADDTATGARVPTGGKGLSKGALARGYF